SLPIANTSCLAVLISTGSKLVRQKDVFRRRAQGFPFAPTVIWRHLPFLPEGMVVGDDKDLLAAVGISADQVQLDLDVRRGASLVTPVNSPAAIGSGLRDAKHLAEVGRKNLKRAILIVLRERPAEFCLGCLAQ